MKNSTAIEISKSNVKISLYVTHTKRFPANFTVKVKFSFSEKATKICAIVLMVLKFT